MRRTTARFGGIACWLLGVAGTIFGTPAAAADPQLPYSFEAGEYKYDPSKAKSDTICVLDKDNRLTCTPSTIILRGDAASSIRLVKGSDAQIQISKIVVTAGQTYKDQCLNFDEIDSADSEISDVLVLLHLDTFMFPSYEPWRFGTLSSENDAKKRLRGGCTNGTATVKADHGQRVLSLPIDRAAPYTTFTVYDDANKPLTLHVPVKQRNWWIDAGVLFSWARVTRDSIRTEVVAGTTQVKVVQYNSSREADYMTGAAVTAFPNNYPNWGISLGVGSGLENKPAWLTGLSLRLLSEEKSSVATITWGRAWMPVRTYNLREGDIMELGDARLEGEVKYRSTKFIGLQLGFAVKGL